MTRSTSISKRESAQAVDLRCSEQEREGIQPHGALLVVEPESFAILQASENVSQYFGKEAQELLGKSLEQVVGRSDAAEIRTATPKSGDRTALVTIGSAADRRLQARVHAGENAVLLEFEKDTEEAPLSFRNFHPLVSKFLAKFEGLESADDLLLIAAEEVREVSGFDRVLIYELDDERHGRVRAESRNSELPSGAELRLPVGPVPDRVSSHVVWTRLIVDVDEDAVRIVPQINPSSGKSMDLTPVGLRAPSAIEREYLHSLSAAASMRLPISRGGSLWGVIECHSRRPRRIGTETRSICEFLAQIVSVQLDGIFRASEHRERIRLKSMESALLTQMATYQNFVDGLTETDELLRFGRAAGAAVLFENRCVLKGKTPKEEQVRALGDWLHQHSEDEIFCTDSLRSMFAPAADYADKVSGVLAIRISKLYRSYVLWFRPEVVQGVSSPNGEIGAPKSRPWSRMEIEAAIDLRNSIVGIVLRKAEEMAELSSELERSNKELEAFSYSVSHDLRAPFRHIVGFSELLKAKEADRLSSDGQRYIETIIDAARFAGKLVDNLLQLSRITRTAMYSVSIDLNQLVNETKLDLAPDLEGREVEWHIGKLPTVTGDPMMFRLVWRNLLSNAVKYTKPREVAVIAIECIQVGNEYVISVRDNGVGFDMRYSHKLFGVFQRLHRQEDFEGTGVGLANVRRIISRHNGRTWAEGKLNEGATFYFTLPAPAAETR